MLGSHFLFVGIFLAIDFLAMTVSECCYLDHKDWLEFFAYLLLHFLKADGKDANSIVKKHLWLSYSLQPCRLEETNKNLEFYGDEKNRTIPAYLDGPKMAAKE
ncbi:uncharacterized protein E5676_scaffold303G00640 [Cucumis melo var. makuwa]|nr:uncharacterized protein E6C27_scaffold243G00270 [Cucumis melo var. makuwa]TYK28854.1 uncharacterized protein E5676_scaffold303G00640 [Cucumis melo var. makuwa]